MNVSVSPASVTLVEPSGSETVNPATSSSVVDTETVWSARGSNESSDEASTTEIVTVLFTVPSIKLSSTPVTVTTCAVSQFADVNVSEVVTVASPVSDEVMERMTSVFGCAFRTTVNVSVSPASVHLWSHQAQKL